MLATLLLSALAATAAPAPAKRQQQILGSVGWNGQPTPPDATEGNTPMCLTVLNGQFYDGSPVGIAECGIIGLFGPGSDINQGQSFYWTASDDNPGVTSLQVAGTNYCIDFGEGGGSNGTPMKIWTCYPSLFQQTFYWTAYPDQHIAVYGGTQCLDVERGTNNVQSYQCSGGDPQQLWNAND